MSDQELMSDESWWVNIQTFQSWNERTLRYVLPGPPESPWEDQKLQLPKVTCLYWLLSLPYFTFLNKLLPESLSHGLLLGEIQTRTLLLTVFADKAAIGYISSR